jgi:hypothetical protein
LFRAALYKSSAGTTTAKTAIKIKINATTLEMA